MSVWGSSIAAQVPPAVVRAAEAKISDTALAGALTALEADSMRDRATPSPALDRTATYLAAHLERIGVKEGSISVGRGDHPEAPTWIWRYPIPGQQRLQYSGTYLVLADGVTVRDMPVLAESGYGLVRWTHVHFDRTAHFAAEIEPPVVPQTFNNLATGEVTAFGSEYASLVAGPQTPSSLTAILDSADLADRVVFYVPPAGADSAAMRQVITRLYAVSRGVVIVRETDSAAFAATVAAWQHRSLPLVDAYMSTGGDERWPWAIDIRPRIAIGILAAVGIDLQALRGATAPILKDLGSIRAILQTATDTVGTAPVTAPIVLGIIPGTDSVLSQEYVMLATPMDTPARTSGVNLAGFLALARAFRDSAIHLRRSVVLLATSGETGTQTAWGSRFLAQAILEQRAGLGYGAFRSALVAFDVGGGFQGDSLIFDGGSALELTPSPAWVAAEHSELGVTLVDRGTPVVPTSTAGVFLANQLPAVALHSPTVLDPSGRKPGPAPDLEAAARRLRYVFYLGYELANADQPPQWSAASRHARVRSVGP